jgi:hypothetical protein
MSIMSDDKPMKSAYELAMERLRKHDEDEGVVQKALTDEQKAAIAELRTVYKAKLAELEILQQGRLRATVDPAERQALEDAYRRERERLTSERDAKIDRLTA